MEVEWLDLVRNTFLVPKPDQVFSFIYHETPCKALRLQNRGIKKKIKTVMSLLFIEMSPSRPSIGCSLDYVSVFQPRYS